MVDVRTLKFAPFLWRIFERSCYKNPFDQEIFLLRFEKKEKEQKLTLKHLKTDSWIIQHESEAEILSDRTVFS